MFEDALAGIDAARAAGVLAVIGVGTNGLEAHADVVIPDLTCASWSGGRLLLANTLDAGPVQG